ncbi:MAG TPA: cyanophycinase [Flavisolibacter sp.]|jgi:cyanophycinase|nr:cyanophycinase [Flavisolibacter sp.]
MEEKKNGCPVPRGTLLLIGGAENKGEQKAKHKQTPSNFERLEVLTNFIKLTHKKDPSIEVITTASEKGDASFEEYKKAFLEMGIKHVHHLHHTSRKEVLGNESFIDRIKKADGVFMAGGDQLKYTSVYGGTPFLTVLKERYIHDRIVIAGTSAGAMAMSTPMIYAGNDEVQELGGMIKITTGLEFMKDVCIDTHFVHRGRIVRMAQVVVTNPTSIGMGIEEDTAAIVRNGVDMEVIGTGTIIILEGFDITETNIEEFTAEKPISVRNLKMHILSGGNTYTIPHNNPPHY